MRRTLTIALGSAVALVTAAVAFAVVPSAVGVSETTATFTASTAVNVKTRTCANDPYTVTDGRYKGGTITFADAALELDGPLTFHARTTLNTTTGLGYVEGSFRVKDDDTRFAGRFSGTLKGGNLVGFLHGHVARKPRQGARQRERTVRPGNRVRRRSARLGQLGQRARRDRRPSLQEA